MHCSPFPPRYQPVQPQLERYRLVRSDAGSLPIRIYSADCLTLDLAHMDIQRRTQGVDASPASRAGRNVAGDRGS